VAKDGVGQAVAAGGLRSAGATSACHQLPHPRQVAGAGERALAALGTGQAAGPGVGLWRPGAQSPWLPAAPGAARGSWGRGRGALPGRA
jgi:hypothetical protein